MRAEDYEGTRNRPRVWVVGCYQACSLRSVWRSEKGGSRHPTGVLGFLLFFPCLGLQIELARAGFWSLRSSLLWRGDAAL